MKKKRLNWRKIWKEFDRGVLEKKQGNWMQISWETQKGLIMSLVENDRNEKPKERKRKTVK